MGVSVIEFTVLKCYFLQSVFGVKYLDKYITEVTLLLLLLQLPFGGSQPGKGEFKVRFQGDKQVFHRKKVD